MLQVDRNMESRKIVTGRHSDFRQGELFPFTLRK